MQVNHDFPNKSLTEEQRERLDELISNSMQLYFELEDYDKANNVLLKGTEVIKGGKEKGVA